MMSSGNWLLGVIRRRWSVRALGQAEAHPGTGFSKHHLGTAGVLSALNGESSSNP